MDTAGTVAAPAAQRAQRPQLHWLRQRWLTALLAVAALAAFALPSLPAWFEYDASHPWQIWRWPLGHFAHFDGEHLFWSLAVFVALLGWLEPLGRGRLVLVLGTAATAIPAALAAFAPELPSYRGLSGIDSALFVLLMASWLREAWRENRRGLLALTALAGLGFVAKLGYELIAGAGVFAGSAGYVPVPLAHAVGGAVGIGFGLLGGRAPLRADR
ncbi:MAG: hypothetical protein FJ265_03850 [Planctomycetes bacterium]|nr:hypothetical protein [Planctomycetota bacterium]